MYIMFNAFTGFHRVFTEVIEFDKENPQKFKDDYVGRFVISASKIVNKIYTFTKNYIKYTYITTTKC